MNSHKLMVFMALLMLAVFTCSVAAGVTPGTKQSLSTSQVSAHKVNARVQTMTVDADYMQMNKPVRGVADETQALQGGENIASAVAITAMPFSSTGTTAGYADDYEEACASSSPSPDVVYSYTPAQDELLTVSLCQSSYFTNLWIYENDATTVTACNRFSNSCPAPRSLLENVSITAGNTYYIVVDCDETEPAGGAYQIDCSVIVAPPETAPKQLHPAMAESGTGRIVIAWQDTEIDPTTFELDTVIVWTGSTDGGASFMSPIYYDLTTDWPSLDYWGADTLFYGTMVPGPDNNDGAPIYLMTVTDPGFSSGYDMPYWNFGSYGWHDMKASDIACDNGQESWRFGIISMVHSTTYSDGMVDGPFILYQTTGETQATISWFWGLDGCQSTSADIDHDRQLAYSVWDLMDTATGTWNVLIRKDDFTDIANAEPELEAWTWGDTLEQMTYPSVAANGGNIVVVSEYWDENTGSDHDIVCLYGSDGDITAMTGAVVVATADEERYPDLSHISGLTYRCTFYRGDTLMATTTEDAGVTWSAPVKISGTDVAVAEHRGHDQSEHAENVIWEYALADTILVHYGPTTGVQDADADGYADDVDNCPLAYNPLQEDANSDGIGDACCCVGIRGNFNGDSGEQVNIVDMTGLVAFLFSGGPACGCPNEANVNGDVGGSINIVDMTYLVAYLFSSGPAPVACP